MEAALMAPTLGEGPRELRLLGFGGTLLRSRCPANPHPIEACGPRAGWLASEEALEGTRPKAGWELVGLDFVRGIDSNVGQYVNHIRPRHAADAKYPQSPRNSRFLPAILSMSTLKTQFDEELDALFNDNTPIPEFNPNGRLSLEFVLPFAVGFDQGNMPTNSWTVILSPVGNGIFQIQTTYPGHPDSGN